MYVIKTVVWPRRNKSVFSASSPNAQEWGHNGDEEGSVFDHHVVFDAPFPSKIHYDRVAVHGTDT